MASERAREAEGKSWRCTDGGLSRTRICFITFSAFDLKTARRPRRRRHLENHRQRLLRYRTRYRRSIETTTPPIWYVLGPGKIGWRLALTRGTRPPLWTRFALLGGSTSRCGLLKEREKHKKWQVANTDFPQVLAVDLLNPSPQAEARKHKLKVCHHSASSTIEYAASDEK